MERSKGISLGVTTISVVGDGLVTNLLRLWTFGCTSYELIETKPHEDHNGSDDVLGCQSAVSLELRLKSLTSVSERLRKRSSSGVDRKCDQGLYFGISSSTSDFALDAHQFCVV